MNLVIHLYIKILVAESAGALEYTVCISIEG